MSYLSKFFTNLKSIFEFLITEILPFLIATLTFFGVIIWLVFVVLRIMK